MRIAVALGTRPEAIKLAPIASTAEVKRSLSTLADTDPTSQEHHLEFHWLPIRRLAESDVRPSVLKVDLVAAGENRTPFWHAWNGQQ